MLLLPRGILHDTKFIDANTFPGSMLHVASGEPLAHHCETGCYPVVNVN